MPESELRLPLSAFKLPYREEEAREAASCTAAPWLFPHQVAALKVPGLRRASAPALLLLPHASENLLGDAPMAAVQPRRTTNAALPRGILITGRRRTSGRVRPRSHVEFGFRYSRELDSQEESQGKRISEVEEEKRLQKWRQWEEERRMCLGEDYVEEEPPLALSPPSFTRSGTRRGNALGTPAARGGGPSARGRAWAPGDASPDMGGHTGGSSSSSSGEEDGGRRHPRGRARSETLEDLLEEPAFAKVHSEEVEDEDMEDIPLRRPRTTSEVLLQVPEETDAAGCFQDVEEEEPPSPSAQMGGGRPRSRSEAVIEDLEDMDVARDSRDLEDDEHSSLAFGSRRPRTHTEATLEDLVLDGVGRGDEGNEGEEQMARKEDRSESRLDPKELEEEEECMVCKRTNLGLYPE